jgi:type I restriction enzyme S subunit
MKSNYKPIGDYLNLVEERNKELQDLPLIGLSITKQFITSIANTIGTDMSTYRMIYKNQFAYSAVTSRNGDKLTIALFKDLEKGLISQAYTPFEITDTNKLLPEYLMMWFSRPEFDRYARFNWEDLCESLMPIPSITKQKEIVKEYNTIVNRIKLNEKLCQKLEETAQAIYKQWFIDFEFPNENGEPYKSNGGEMMENELGEIPKGWEISSIKDLGKVVTGKTPSSENPEHFGDEMPFITPGDFKTYNKFAIRAERNLSKAGYEFLKGKILKQGSVIVTCIGSDMGKVVIASEECITNQQMNSIETNKEFYRDYH